MSILSAIMAKLNARRSYDASPPAAVDTGDVLVIQDTEVRVVPYGAPSNGTVLTVDSTAANGWSIAAPRVSVEANGVAVGTRPTINFASGGGCTITSAITAGKVTITITVP